MSPQREKQGSSSRVSVSVQLVDRSVARSSFEPSQSLRAVVDQLSGSTEWKSCTVRFPPPFVTVERNSQYLDK